jgi:hypothetical protein
MKNYKICIKTALAVFAVALSACSSDDDIADNSSNSQEKPVTNKTMTFRATMDDGSGSNSKATRTDFNGNNTIWATDDNIYIQNKASVPDETDRPAYAEFGITDGVGTKEADFSGGPIRANMDGTSDQFYAYYPSSSFDTNREVMAGNIPTVQTATDGTYPQTLHYMTAYSTNSTFNFKNVCALLKITLTNNTTISRIKVVANPTLSAMDAEAFTYTSIAGGFTATIGSDGTASVTPTKETETETEETYVELRAADDNGTIKGRTSLGNGTFYMVVLPATISKGFTLILEDKDGNVYQRINSSVTSFVRNKMYNLGSYDCTSATSLQNSKLTALGNDVVDLDLPSGTIWCKKNTKTRSETSYLGLIPITTYYVDGFVANESDYGDYYSWGKTHVTSALGVTYSLPDLDSNNTTLKGDADGVYAYDHQYCLPVYAQMYEFYNHLTDRTIVTENSNKCAKFTSSTGRSILIPYAGYYYSTRLVSKNEQARYWSRTYTGYTGVWPTRVHYAYDLDLKITNNVPEVDTHDVIFGARSWYDKGEAGRSFRPVVTNVQIAEVFE